MRPLPEVYDENNPWETNKARYGLRSSPKARQDHLAARPTTTVGMTRLKSESNACRDKGGTTYSMIFVRDLVLLGKQHIIDKISSELQQRLLLRLTGVLTPGPRAVSWQKDHAKSGLALLTTIPRTSCRSPAVQHNQLQPSSNYLVQQH